MSEEQKTAHTPGPWSVGYHGSDIHCVNVKIGGTAKLFDVRGWGYLTGMGHGALGLPEDKAIEIQNANARLAASAPELLAAAKLALNTAEDWIHDRLDGTLSLESELADLEPVRVAIAKAEGRS